MLSDCVVFIVVLSFFFCKQKTAYEMRISDWSSDVCSSDLSPQLYLAVNKIVPRMVRQTEEKGAGDFWVDEKQKQVHLSEEGMQHADELLREAGVIDQDSGLYDSKNLAEIGRAHV